MTARERFPAWLLIPFALALSGCGEARDDRVRELPRDSSAAPSSPTPTDATATPKRIATH